MPPPNAALAFQFFNVSYPAEYVAHVEINRPKKMNAFHNPMWLELKAAFESLSGNPEVRCILLSGAGDRAFTTGLDVSSGGISKPGQSSQDPSRLAYYLRAHILTLQSCVSSISSCQKPVIALLHGYAYGLAVDLATSADIRLCASDVKLCVKEVDIGLAADVGTLSRIGKVVGGVSSWVKEVCLSARVFGAEEALKVGFVSGPVCKDKSELMEEGMRLAKVIASKSPVAVQGTKNILDASWGRTVEDNLNYTAIWNGGMLQSGDVERAMRAGLQKRKPTFEKL